MQGGNSKKIENAEGRELPKDLEHIGGERETTAIFSFMEDGEKPHPALDSGDSVLWLGG